jgi:hypothetical protein
MKLRRKSLLVRLAFPFGGAESWHRHTVTLCQLFWRCVWTVFSASVLVVAVIAFVLAAVYHPRGVCMAIGVFAITVALCALSDWQQDRRRNRVKEPGLIRTAFYGIKHRICPIIHLTDDAQDASQDSIHYFDHDGEPVDDDEDEEERGERTMSEPTETPVVETTDETQTPDTPARTRTATA